MPDTPCKVVFNDFLTGDYFRIGLETGYSEFQPGQFGMLEVPRCEGVLLRRPFSLARQEGAVTEILYKVVGKGTAALSRVSVGTPLSLLGPLGNGFSIPENGKIFIAVAGGYGVAPFLEMAVQLKRKKKNFHLFYGARSVSDLICLEELKKLGVTLHLSTEDGTAGFHGLITELLTDEAMEDKPDMVWCCGPNGLLAAVQSWADNVEVPCELSVEETMGCGTGLCLGCVVKSSNGNYVRACKEGPVFSRKDLIFE